MEIKHYRSACSFRIRLARDVHPELVCMIHSGHKFLCPLARKARVGAGALKMRTILGRRHTHLHPGPALREVIATGTGESRPFIRQQVYVVA